MHIYTGALLHPRRCVIMHRTAGGVGGRGGGDVCPRRRRVYCGGSKMKPFSDKCRTAQAQTELRAESDKAALPPNPLYHPSGDRSPGLFTLIPER
ncbi:hypothetical protein EVAR_21921_1 [Eumeta japonica]|uniref:Uncharacterized protein n=1 Tax=Eumeta variegata TaxID=151549 RepID=A0A4C1XJR5_EUMVA|nr:hypothetical protein EVAR_21921_1 [Eumeta japonica]